MNTSMYLLRAARSPCVSQKSSREAVLRAASAIRLLNLHEYQSQQLMRDAGINVPRGFDVNSREAALSAAKSFDGKDIVVKAQVLAGGRGLGTFKNGFKGGVHICYDPEKAADVAESMIGQHLVTKQTGEQGRLCSKALVTERMYLRREMYFAITYDRESQGPVIVASRVGGTSIEDIAAADPSAITKIPVNMVEGLTKADAEKCARALGFANQHAIDKAIDQVEKLYSLFIEKDATLVEVNPIAETPEGDVVCIDAKINFDDNAEFRHKEIFSMRDVSQEDPREVTASAHDLNYIGLDGNIGCLVNGAGLAMATMDIIKLHGGDPANFLDVGGSATETQVTEAFKILNDDTKVEAILVNIFGGIMRCDVIAQGIINAAKTIDMRVPVVVRLQGNKVDEAKALIRASGLKLVATDDLDQAAKKACTLAEIVRLANTVDVTVAFQS
ncbi:Succinate--CoA ligase [ADP-forming] subunit beta, mitochondrial [Gracilariopsis chorda]|uniref:Succinate--CoA ligase [ADP-forming] subunit beta, mitochondrial n=1 Tax=Gracilariopsis chorda TaxID=448386 RepID=A0A2V3IXL3_9FLOR|nr:Succinate--CoA ligase [ADP-forming] subunit beta, mitochondrial [Gracilariopsis chorda]|eukprot:PXF46803.1 Succinate--CoA ligase [ADP-forming] subunit beta, mitochondrial [Gracilariopsis chorda]